MLLGDMSKPLTSKFLNETSAKRFGKKLKLEKFNMEQLYDARNRLRTKLHTVETTESYNSVNKGESYHQNKMFLDIVNAEILERESKKSSEPKTRWKNKKSRVNENSLFETAEQEAELIMAAKDMVDKLSGWMEHTSEMQSETMLSLGDAIRVEKGSRESQEFIQVVRPALEQMYSVMEETRQKLISGVEMLTGERQPDIGQDDMDMSMDDEQMGSDMGDDFSSSEAAKGGNSNSGREKRESVDYGLRQKARQKKR